MRWVRGVDLGQLLRESPRPPVEPAVQGLAQVAEALDALHRAGLVHRDVKPSNVLVEGGAAVPRDARPVRWFLADFGIARKIDQTTDLTGRGFLGTVPYTAPERFEGSPATPSSDIYSFGCLAYEVLVGEPPFGRTAAEVALAHGRRTQPHRRQVLPPRLRAAFAAGLAGRPGDRPLTAERFVTSLREALDGLPPTTRIPISGAGSADPGDAPTVTGTEGIA
jgi:serine/threonine-protein kinase